MQIIQHVTCIRRLSDAEFCLQERMIGMYTNFSCEARFPYNPVLHYARGSFMKENNSFYAK